MRWLLALLGMLVGGAAGPAPAAGPAGKTSVISGRVVDPRGRPVGGATVYASLFHPATTGDWNPRPRVSEARSSANGSFRLEVSTLEGDSWGSVAATRAGYGPGGQSLRPGRSMTGLRLELTKPAFVTGKVVDRDGHPVARAQVSVMWASRDRLPGAVLPPESVGPPATTDAQGRYRVGPVPAGSQVILKVEHPAYARWRDMGMRSVGGGDGPSIVLLPSASVVGRVLDADGHPAANVPVRCQWSWMPVPNEKTNANGQFRFTRLEEGGPRGGYYLFNAELPDFVTDPQGVILSQAEARCPDLRLVRGGFVVGKVTDENGKPLARVGLYSQREFDLPGMRTQAQGSTTMTGADGTYRLRLPPGKWRVSPASFGFGYVSTTRWDQYPTREVAEGSTTTADFVLHHAGSLRVRVVTAAGQPAAGATVQARGERGGSSVQQAYAAGRLLLEGYFLPEDRLELTVFSHDRREAALVEAIPARMKGEMVVRLQQMPMLTGRLTDRKGAAVAGARVVAERMVPQGDISLPEPVAETRSDARGRFALPVPAEVQYRVTVEARGFVRTDRYPIPVGSRGAPKPVQIALERADGFASGVVVGPEGQPLQGVEVSAWRQGSTRFFVINETTMTDAHGRFRLANLPPGALDMNAHRPGYNGDFHHQVRVGATNLRFMLSPIEEAAPRPPTPAVGTRAPDIRVARWVNGAGPGSLAELRGKTVILQFSAAYNRAAEPSNLVLKSLHAALKEKGKSDTLLLALYDPSMPAEEVDAYAKAEGLPFPVGLVEAARERGPGSAGFEAYGVRQLPSVLVIDRVGIVRAVNPTREELLKLAE